MCSSHAQPPAASRMQALRFTERFQSLLGLAGSVADSIGAEGILLLLDGTADWQRLRRLSGNQKVVVAGSNAEESAAAADSGLMHVHVGMPDAPVYERLTQAVLESVADDLFSSGSQVVALYAGFDADTIDSISVINLDEHLNRLTGRDLRQLETRVPLDTLKMVVDLAVEIGREGREGKPVGTLFVVGDARKVLASSHPAGFDPVRGYSRKERNLAEPRVREGIKEIAQMDGAIIVSADGTVEAACRYLDCSAADVTLSKGLGARHWAAAAVSRATNAVAVTVSESNGTVRIFQNGEVVLRIEPQLRRPMVWKEFEYEPPPSELKP
ncbi:MAG: diadenylate cyclase [Thermoguttaceae bacterium]|nr:diadenylate cyclase [Thermoguttaceae bacterium]